MSRRCVLRRRHGRPAGPPAAYAYAALALMPVLGACGGGGGGAAPAASTPPPQVQSPPPQPAPPGVTPRFVNATSASNISHWSRFSVRDLSAMPVREQSLADLVDEITVGGAAVGDYDADGDIDIFITRGDMGPNLLYRNEGGLIFADVAQSAGLANTKSANENYAHSGPTFADMDGDGDLDLFLGGVYDDPSKVFRNNGDGTFTDVTQGSGIDTLVARFTLSAAFGDYDLDGDLDMFLSHWGTPRDLTAPGDTQNLWENVSAGGKIEFRSVSVSAGISPSIITLPDPKRVNEGDAEFTFTPAFAHVDGDEYPDILSAADFNQSMVFLNNGDGTFRNATDTSVIADDNGMGAAVGDYDNDGDLDWFVSSIYSVVTLPPPEVTPVGNRLYRNDGNGVFTDVTLPAQVANGGWGWAACFIDFENDGDLDIYHTNGWMRVNPTRGNDWNDHSRAFVQVEPGRFEEQADDIGLYELEQGRGAACADFDDDGDTDILLLHLDAVNAATLWKNDTTGNNYLRVRVRGKAPNTEAVGTRVYARVGATEQMREIMVGSNFTAQNPTSTVIFGLGTAGNVDELRFVWPDGTVTTYPGVVANQTFEASAP